MGAGFSRPAGLPRWESLLHRIVADCKVEDVDMPGTFDGLAYSDIDHLQSRIVSSAGRGCACASMQHQLSIEKELPAMRLQLDALFQLPLAAVITWNWDNVLDQRCTVLPPQETQSEYGGRILSARPGSQPPLLKLQGSVSDPDSMVLDAEDYRRVKPARDRFLRQLYVDSDRVVLHIGQGLGGLTGGVVGEVLRREDHDDETASPPAVRHYAVACDGTPADEVEAARRVGLQVLFYSVEEGHEKGIRELLNRIAKTH